jgi:hypothetical protein
VYARFDLDAGGFDSDVIDWGTTNVDINEPLRAALAGVAGGDPLRMSVGVDEMVVETLPGVVREKKVPLPDRWLRGFAEAQIASAAMVEIADLATASARATLRDLPAQKTGNRAMWIAPSVSGVRLSQRADRSSASLIGPQRLAAFRRLLPYVQRLVVQAPPPRRRAAMAGRQATTDALVATTWIAHLDNGRFTLVVSPELFRGFSGEGAVLDALSAADAATVDAIGNDLRGQSDLDPEQVGAAHAVPLGQAIDALTVLGAAGRVGHDASAATYFHRDLPFDRSSLEAMQPRLIDARRLVSEGSVRIISDDGASVRSDEATYTVRSTVDGATCTCTWFAKHRGERGPCKHVLAVALARRASAEGQ